MPKDDLTPKDPHDRLFKRVMSDEANVRQFIKEFLPKELSSQIDLKDMKLIPTEKVKGYNKYYMDIAVECKIANSKGQLYFVFEHKSYPDPGILLQILSYMAVLWDEQRKKNIPLTPVIPVVIYHGDSSWNVTTHFQGQFDSLNESVKPYIPEFNYVLIDLTRFSIKEIEERAETTPFLAGSLQLMKLVAMQDIKGIMGVAVIAELPKEEKMILFLYLYYTLDVDQRTMQRIVKELGGEEIMPSLAEKLQNAGKQKMLIKLFRRKFGLTSLEEKKILSVNDESKLDAAAEAILDAKSKEEVLKLLEL
ncbi:Rpn family recombination-promoting nuclease/putative transposase [Acetomicrobium sp.]|uniref:Rpn family recombination-promoting nuclease/putative transposase n=1 Tax=Acetomicrobium sp. TaxID=1872099 RepID=UPI002B2610CD|nr:Rpn family recombination-promoting nuclease/putative transposase [Acetomicrobium sp.]